MAKASSKKSAVKQTSKATQSFKIQFHYEKAPTYQTVHVDGLIGGVLPSQQMLSINFFSERPPIPKSVVHEVDSDGRLGKQLPEETDGKSGLVRELHFGTKMSLPTAKAVRGWLDDAIKKLESASKSAKVTRKKKSPKKSAK